MKVKKGKATSTQRFNRCYDRLVSKRLKEGNIEAVFRIEKAKQDFKYLYELGYKQGVRDAHKVYILKEKNNET